MRMVGHENGEPWILFMHDRGRQTCKKHLFIFAPIMPEKKSGSNRISSLITSLRQSILLLRKNDPLRMAGATAFFTTFALPPIVFIVGQLFGWFIGRGKMGRRLIENISDTLGKEGAGQVRQVIKNIRGFSNSWYVLVFGFLFLVFVATTLFSVIRNSLNQVWQINIKDRPGVLFLLGIRARSFAVILLIGILFFASLLFESLKLMAADYVNGIWRGSGIYIRTILGNLASVIIVAAWFILLFRYLADA